MVDLTTMRPGPRRKGRRFFPPIEVLDADAFVARDPIILVGPDSATGYTFEGTVQLHPFIVPSPASTGRPYLGLAKTWDERPEVPCQARDRLGTALECAEQMRLQHLRVGIDRFGTGRVYVERVYAEWARLVGTVPGAAGV